MARTLVRLGTFGLTAAVALLFSGCFRYVPAELASVPPGRDVRVELTRVGFARLPEIPSVPGPEVSGTVLRRETDQLTLRVPVPIRRDGMVMGTVDQDVAIPTSEIVRLERRVFSRERTGVVALGGLAMLFAAFQAFGSDGPPVGEQPDPPIDEEAGSGGAALRIPLASFSRLLP